MQIALNGGAPLRRQEFPAWPQYDSTEEDALHRALHQGQWWRMSGREVEAFEAEFAAHHDAPFAVAVTNGTHALEVALMAAGVGPGAEVIVPGFTFISTSMAVQRVGAVPVVADVDLETYCLDPASVEAVITPRTRAIIPVHMSGHFADMDALQALCDRHDLILIQDAAHAHGAAGRGGRKVGAWGSMACFSFQNFKLMTAGEGGMILCPDQETRDRVFLYANCGRPAGDRAYQHVVLGSNYRISEFQAAVLRCQLARLDAQTDRREANAAVVMQALESVPGIIPQAHAADAVRHPHYMFMVRLDRTRYPDIDRNRLVDALVAEGLPAFRAYQALYRIPAFHLAPTCGINVETLARQCPATEAIAADAVWFHHRALLGTPGDALDIVRALEKVLAAEELLAPVAA